MMQRNAIIMAAGTASRFVPLSQECPKGLLEVKGEILIERQIRQLHEAGITDITIVVGCKSEMFEYLKEKFGVSIVLNEDYAKFNNTSSVIRVVDKLANTFVCSSDNYFPDNVFIKESEQSYYSALYADGETEEYCLTTDSDDNITKVDVGGRNSWYMVGHVFFNKEFSDTFGNLLVAEYGKDETRQGYWEDLYIKHLDELPLMKINRYKAHEIEEFDSIDELREFDDSYIADTRSSILKEICQQQNWKESELSGFKRIKYDGDYVLFAFVRNGETFKYDSSTNEIIKETI